MEIQFQWPVLYKMVAWFSFRFENCCDFLYSKRPNYTLLKCFGSLCYITNTQPYKDNFAPQAYKCVFIGYSPR